MRVTITPPNKTLYMERCQAARDCFKHADIMPPFLVTYMCFSVMFRALGGYGGILRYVLSQIYSDVWSNLRERAWWTWHMYIRCRSLPEIQELIDQKLEEITGDDSSRMVGCGDCRGRGAREMSKVCDERPVECGDPACVCHEYSARMPSESPAITEGAAGFLESGTKNVSKGPVGSGIGISDDADLRQRARISRAIDNWIVEENAKRGRETVFPLQHLPLRSLAEAAAQDHILHTEDDCSVFHAEDLQCPVCEGGLAVCAVCGEYESGLDKPCQPRNPDYWNSYRAGRIDALEKFNEDLVELVRIRRERMGR